jgi:hypothetical protein
MGRCSITFKNDSLVRFVIPTGPFAKALPHERGMVETNGADIKIVNGFRDGVPSKFHSVFGLTFPRTHQ